MPLLSYFGMNSTSGDALSTLTEARVVDTHRGPLDVADARLHEALPAARRWGTRPSSAPRPADSSRGAVAARPAAAAVKRGRAGAEARRAVIGAGIVGR